MVLGERPDGLAAVFCIRIRWESHCADEAINHPVIPLRVDLASKGSPTPVIGGGALLGDAGEALFDKLKGGREEIDAGLHAALEEGGLGVLREDGDGGLEKDSAGVDAGIDVMEGDTGL